MRNERVDQKLKSIRETKTPYDIELGGILITVFENVYPTSDLSEIVVECMNDRTYGIKKGNYVLDYGTGTGFLAIQAALRGANVVATDINPASVRCAKFNVAKHGLNGSVDIRLGKSFDPVRPDEKFNVILAGLPWDKVEVSDFLDLSMYDPDFQMRKELFLRAKEVLLEDGRIFFTYAEFAQQKYPIEKFDEDYNHLILKERSIKGIPHYVYMIKPKARPTV
jgi:cyclopropane fatty-acyl-phospholipid synthase-like methyltransferase